MCSKGVGECLGRCRKRWLGKGVKRDGSRVEEGGWGSCVEGLGKVVE